MPALAGVLLAACSGSSPDKEKQTETAEEAPPARVAVGSDDEADEVNTAPGVAADGAGRQGRPENSSLEIVRDLDRLIARTDAEVLRAGFDADAVSSLQSLDVLAGRLRSVRADWARVREGTLETSGR